MKPFQVSTSETPTQKSEGESWSTNCAQVVQQGK